MTWLTNLYWLLGFLAFCSTFYYCWVKLVDYWKFRDFVKIRKFCPILDEPTIFPFTDNFSNEKLQVIMPEEVMNLDLPQYYDFHEGVIPLKR